MPAPPPTVEPFDLAILAEIWDELGLCPCCGGMPREKGSEIAEEEIVWELRTS